MVQKVFPNQLFRSYCTDFAAVGEFYQYEFRPDFKQLERRYGNLKEPVHRRELVDSLLQYNKEIGAPQAVLANIGKLAQKGTPVIIGGQQAGFLTGPLYTLYKAMAVIQLARKAGSLLGCHVVPVFWIASDDHDFQEINHINLLDTGSNLKQITLPGSYKTRPAGFIDVKEQYLETVDKVAAATPQTEFKDDYLAGIYAKGRASSKLTDWFARILTDLLGERGLVLFDPLVAATEPIKKEFCRLFQRKKDDFYKALQDTNKRLEEGGFDLQVEKDENHTNTFVFYRGERRPLCKFNGRIKSRGGNLEWSEAEFARWLELNPQRFSPDVLLRPLFQDYTFPVLASVNGPGEVAYQAQLCQSFKALGLEQPPLFPRPSLTIVEARFCRYLERWQVTPAAILGNGDSLLQELLSKRAPVDIDRLFKGTEQRIRDIHTNMQKELALIEPQLQDLGKKNLKKISEQIQFLYRKTINFQRRNEENLVGQYRRLCLNLCPQGKMQERTFNIFPYLIRYGPELITHIYNALGSVESNHGFLCTDGRLL